MDFINNLDDNSILLIPDNIKDKVLDYICNLNKELNIKIMNFDELKKRLIFDYDGRSIKCLMDTGLTYNTSIEYINNMYYIFEDSYECDKLDYLKELKNKISDYLIHDELFIDLLKSKSKLYVFGFDYIDKYNNYLLDIVSKYIPIEKLEKSNLNYSHTVYNLNTMEDEISFVAENICSLLDEGVDINNIYIANYSDEYYFTLNRIFKSYNIPFYIKSETSLYTTSIGKYFIDNLNSNILDDIKNNFNMNNKYNCDIYNKLLDLVNKYYWTNICDIKDILIGECKHIKLSNSHYKNEVKTIRLLDNYIFDNEYVFLIGFNSNVPKFKRDIDYINDDIKLSFMDKTSEYNTNIKTSYLNAINNIKNLIITYKESSSFNKYLPSSLISNMKCENIKFEISKYSNDINKLNLCKKIDRLIKFNESDEFLSILNNNYDVLYNTYSNTYDGISNIKEYIDNNITFSYSNISTYYLCPFKFYLDSIIKLNVFDETLDTIIGSAYHYTLEKCLDTDLDIDMVYDEYFKNCKKDLDSKDKFFINFLRGEIHFVVDAIRWQYSHSKHNKVWNEKEIEIPHNKYINTVLKGFVDKILLLDNKCIVVDYKTNQMEIDRDLLEFGIGIQLPIYLYLLNKLDSNIEVLGLYLQHILNLNVKYEKDKDLILEKMNNMKLTGITFESLDISNFDDTYEHSDIISGLAMTKSGFRNNKHLFNMDDKKELFELVEKLIDNCIKNVSNGDFKIYPIKIENKKDGCEYCKYKDICFRKPKDYNYKEVKC